MRRLGSVLTLAFGLITAGCAATQTREQLEYELSKARSDLNATQDALQHERAKTIALARDIGDNRREWETAKAEASALKSRASGLSEHNAQLEALIAKRAEEPLRRPPTQASPLPAELDEALAVFAKKYAGRVWYERGRGALSFANDKLFAPGSDTVRTDAHAALGDLAEIAALPAARDLELIIVGHTDDTPITKPDTRVRHPSNWHLSVHRAIAVKNVLVSAGLADKRMGVMGYGPHRPAGDDRARNRRVEVFLVRQDEVQSISPVRPPARARGGSTP